MAHLKGAVLHFLLWFAICLLFYGNTIGNDYAYDDSVVITDNQFTQKGIRGIAEIFANDTFRGSYDGAPTVERYRPLSVATFALEYELFGQNPHVSHFNNVWLFGLTAFALQLLLAELFGKRGYRTAFLDFPFIATLLFVAHPVHTEVVANIKGRDEILALAGSISATLLILKYVESRQKRYLTWGSVLFLAALFSKENALTFLAIVPLTLYFQRKETWSTYRSVAMPLVAASAVFLAARWSAMGGPGPAPAVDILVEPFAGATLSERLATVAYTFGQYLRLLVFPHPLTIDYYPYHIQLAKWSSPAVWLSILVYAALAAYALRCLKRRSVVSYGILFYLCTFSMVSNLPFSIGTFMSERFLFIPSVGFVIVVAWFLSESVLPRIKHERVVLAAVSLACLAKTHSRNQVWKDDFTLFTTDVETSGNSIKANLAAAVSFLLEAQKVDDAQLGKSYRASALEHARKAVSIYDQRVGSDRVRGQSYDHAIALLGDCYSANGVLDSALETYRKALGSNADREHLCDSIEATIAKSNDVDFKLESYKAFVTLVPDNFMFNYRLGYLYGKEKKNLTESVRYLEKAVELRPNETHALEALSHAYKLSRAYEKASYYLERVATLEPDNPSHPQKLLSLYKLSGNAEKAKELSERLGSTP